MPRGWDPALCIPASGWLRLGRFSPCRCHSAWKAAAWGCSGAMSQLPAGIWLCLQEERVHLVLCILLGQVNAPSHSCDVTLSSVTMMYKVLYI